MSRWDGLKDNDTRPIFKTSKVDQARAAPSHASIKSLRRVRSYEEIMVALRDTRNSDQIQGIFEDIADMNTEQLRKIPAEYAASELVDAFLIESLNKEDACPQLHQTVMDAVNTLLGVPSICSAVTAPLTIDVAQMTGVEERIPNPIGQKLLLALQLRLPKSCSTLTSLIDKIRKLAIGDTLQVDYALLQHYFGDYLPIRTFQTQSLDLLRLVLVTYPDSYKTLKALLLCDFRTKRDEKRCSNCQYVQGTSVLMDLFHDRRCATQVNACIVLLLNSFPLELWLNSRTAGSMKLFAQSVKVDLAQLVRMLICRFSPVESFGKIIHAVLTMIPFPNDPHDNLTRQGIGLVSFVATSIMDLTAPKQLVQCFCECMGGRPKPNGGKTVTSTPLKLWLLDSSVFQEYIFDGLASVRSSSRMTATTLLCAIIRNQPEYANWERIHRIVKSSVASPRHRAEGMAILEAFAAGRSEYAASIPYHRGTSQFLVETLNAVTSDDTSKVRISGLQGFCVLLAADWSFAAESQYVNASVDRMVHSSKHGTSDEKQLALKALGEMMSKFTSAGVIDDAQLAHLCDYVTPVLQDGINESTASTKKAMAIYAFGNLALGLRTRNSQQILLAPESLLQVIDEVGACMKSSNEKVVGNAIRTVGHVCYLAFHEPYASHLGSSQTGKSFQAVVAMLSEKLRHVMGGSTSSGLTWKERSSAKKHGWGSCHSLGLVLDCAIAIYNQDASRAACAVLSNCINHKPALSDKIVIAAIAALKQIEPSRFEVLSHRNGLIGLVISSCIELMVDPNVNSRIRIETEQLLLRTVPILSVTDARNFLHAITSSHLEWLYDWMVNNNMNAEPYEKFAIVFGQMHDWDSNVSLEQRFASRAAWSYREGNDDDKYLDDDEL